MTVLEIMIVLAIIGAVQILILPFVGKSAWVRLGAALGFSGGHVLLSYLFNFNFVFGLPNQIDDLLERFRAFFQGRIKTSLVVVLIVASVLLMRFCRAGS